MGRLEQLKAHARYTTENTTQKSRMQSCVLSCGHLNTDSSVTHAQSRNYPITAHKSEHVENHTRK